MNGTDIFLDTNICIYLLNGDADLVELLEGQSLFISVITEIELHAAKSLSDDELDVLNEFIDSVHIIDLTTQVKKKTIGLRRSSNLKLPDSVIAASAILAGFPFISADKAFNKISELDLILYKKQ